MKRRTFLRISAPIGASPLLLNGVPLNTMSASSLMSLTTCNDIEDRTLVIVQVAGGNDGINTLVPIEQYDTYANQRPNIKLNNVGQSNGVINLDGTLGAADQIGLHPAMTGFKDLYDSGKLKVIQAVSYDNHNRSHFKSTDLWLTGGDGTPPNFNHTTGWMGRYLDHSFPGAAGNPTPIMPDPLGIQIGDPRPSLGFHTNNEHQAAISLGWNSPSNYYNVVNEIGGLPPANVPNSYYGYEIGYISNIEASVEAYAGRISDVFAMGSNSGSITYPDNSFAYQLKTVARLISGGSKTKIFLVSIGGFDTHVEQVEAGAPHTGWHATILGRLSDSLKAFQDDLDAQSLDHKVLTVTFSEFGRKPEENGEFGTDHGKMGPMFVIGTPTDPGVLGTNVDLSNVVSGQLQNPQYDYRQVYHTILQDWLGADVPAVNAAYFGGHSKLPIIDFDNYVVDPSCYINTFALPIELLKFSARLEQNSLVRLQWTTGSEINNDYFEIERSPDGVNFEKIEKVAAIGNSQEKNDYEAIDPNPLAGISYYRLKQIDTDKKYTHSDIESVYLRNEFVKNFKVYPNPAIYDYHVVLTAEREEEMVLKLIDMNGKVVKSSRFTAKKGFNKQRFKVNQLPSGTYVVKLISVGTKTQELSRLIISN